MNMTSHRVYQTGEGERGNEDAAKNLGRLRIKLEKVLPMLIDRDQTGYVKNRFSGENVRFISDVIESYEEKTCQACYSSSILKKRLIL